MKVDEQSNVIHVDFVDRIKYMDIDDSNRKLSKRLIKLVVEKDDIPSWALHLVVDRMWQILNERR